MAVYKVWLTVKDSYGNIKELEAGNIQVDFELGQDELAQIEEALPLEQYIKRDNLEAELKDWATDEEVKEATSSTVKYGDFKFRNENTGEAGN